MKNIAITLIILNISPSYSGSPKYNLAKCESLFKAEQWKEASECFLPAADAGDPKAQYFIGELYLNAQGTEEKDVYAEKMFRKSAEHNYPEGQMALGDLYSLGIVVKKDESVALKWYEKAARQGSEKGMIRLAERYMDGIGTKANEEESLRWYKLAAEKGSESATISLANYYYNKRNAKYFAEARKWLEAAAKASDRVSFIFLGQMIYNGEGGNKDKIEAYKWYALFNKFEKPDPAGRPEALAKELSKEEKKEAERRAEAWLKIHPLKT
jgi:TPR repeat protein